MKTNVRKMSVRTLALLMALLLLLPIFVGLSSALAVTQAEIDALEEEKDTITSEKAALQTEIDALVTEQASVLEQKRVLDERNELTRQEIELINEQIDMYGLIIANKETELEAAEAAEEEQIARFRTRMRSMEENGSLNYLSYLFSADSFSDLLTRIDDITVIMTYDKALEEEYIAARENVETVKAEYESAKTEEEAVRVELEETKAQLEADIAEASAMIAELESQIDENEAFFQELLAAEASMEAEIQQKLAELEEQEKAAAGGNITSTGTYIWPVPGYSPGSAYGWRLHPVYGVMKFHAGEDIGAPTGTPILAADSGTVAVANIGWGGGYGNYVMLNHGGGRTTLYAHMSSLAVSYGQTVSQGQVIGYVGSTGVSTGPHLHFETRVNGSTVDPKSYFSF